MTVGTEKSRKTTVPERLRGESSTTALKAATKRKRSDKAEVLKTKDKRREAVHSTHGQR